MCQKTKVFVLAKKMDFQVPGQAWGSGVGVRCSLLITTELAVMSLSDLDCGTGPNQRQRLPSPEGVGSVTLFVHVRRW